MIQVSHTAKREVGPNPANLKKVNCKMTKTDKVLEALVDGQELTAAQISSRWGVGNPGSLIQSLRFRGYSVYLNTHTDSKGRVTRKYRLGTPSKAVIAAGYRALASGMVA